MQKLTGSKGQNTPAPAPVLFFSAGDTPSEAALQRFYSTHAFFHSAPSEMALKYVFKFRRTARFHRRCAPPSQTGLESFFTYAGRAARTIHDSAMLLMASEIVCHENCFYFPSFLMNLSDIIHRRQPRLVRRGDEAARQAAEDPAHIAQLPRIQYRPQPHTARRVRTDGHWKGFQAICLQHLPDFFFPLGLSKACAKSQGPQNVACRWSAIQTGGPSAACLAAYGDPSP